MKKLDTLSLLGLAVAVLAVVGGVYLEGGHPTSLWQLTALLIVGGGTVGATMLQTPMAIFLRAMKMFVWAFSPPELQIQPSIRKVVRWSQLARKSGLLTLDTMAKKESDPFVRKGLQLLVDGNEPETIRSIMEVDLSAKEQWDLHAAKVFEAMGGYSPTIGILGAVMGLIHVMNNLTDPSKLGVGIATAFVATIYGVGLANLFFLPIANKLKNIIFHQSQFRELIIEGIIAIAQGENPRNIETKLRGYLNQ